MLYMKHQLISNGEQKAYQMSCISAFFFFYAFYFFTTRTHAVTFFITNNCNYTVWAAAVPAGGQHVEPGKTTALNLTPNATRQLRIWGRTNCQFDFSGEGFCETGDCNGRLECESYGTPPATLVEFGQSSNQDFLDISVVDGFNIPIEVSSNSTGCNVSIKCAADIVQQCPSELRAPGGCNGPCSVFKTSEYCCTSGNCGPTSYSRFFKERCPDAYSYPMDDQTSLFTCPTGTNYTVTFCPSATSNEVHQVFKCTIALILNNQLVV